MQLRFVDVVIFCWMWAPAKLQDVDFKPCSPVAYEEEPYTLEYSSANFKGAYFWYLKSKYRHEDNVIACQEDEQSNCNDRISSMMFENDSGSQTYAKTSILFRNVSADQRDAVIRCENHFSFPPFKREVFSCRMRVYTKPRTTRCLPANLSLICTALQVFPDIACTLDLTDASRKTNQTINEFAYSSFLYQRGDVEYKNASCVAELQHLPPGTYSAMVYVKVQSAGTSDIAYMTPVYIKSFNFTVPKTAVSLTQVSMGKCLDNNKGTTAVQLKCEAEGFWNNTRVDWKLNDKKVSEGNTRIEKSEEKVTSTYKFQPVREDSGTLVNCTVLSNTKSGSAIFKVPQFPDLPPEFVNASNGLLILHPGPCTISCQIPGSGSGFHKVNISCSANNTKLFGQVSPGNVGHLNVKNALVLDQALCRCAAVHKFFCYALFADVQVRVKTQPQTTEVVTLPDLGTTPQDTGNAMVYVLSITCSLALLTIILVIILIACKCLNSSGEHIYEDPNIVPGVNPNDPTLSPLSEPSGQPSDSEIDSLGYLKPKHIIPRLPEFDNGRSSKQQTTSNSVFRNKPEITVDSNLGFGETVCSEPLLRSIYMNIPDTVRYSKNFHHNRNRKKTHKICGCVEVESKSQCNEFYISPIDSPSSSKVSLTLHSDAPSNSKSKYKSLTIDNYKTLLGSSNLGLFEHETSGELLENPKSHKFCSKPLQKLEIIKKETAESGSLEDAKSQAYLNWALNGARKSRKSNRKCSKEISRRTSTKDSNYMELHPKRTSEGNLDRKDVRSQQSFSTAGDLVIQ